MDKSMQRGPARRRASQAGDPRSRPLQEGWEEGMKAGGRLQAGPQMKTPIPDIEQLPVPEPPLARATPTPVKVDEPEKPLGHDTETVPLP